MSKADFYQNDRTPSGIAINDLYRQVKENAERSNGSWNGGDVVDVLAAWFSELGFSVDTQGDDDDE